jgi:hypothetical protein
MNSLGAKTFTMVCTDHIDYFSLCLMDDDRTFRKSGAKMSEGYIIILSARLSVSAYLSVIHYQLFYTISHFTYTMSHSIPLVILQTQIFLGMSHFVPLVILHRKPYFTLSHFTH